MIYRVAQVLLVIFGILFLIAPTNLNGAKNQAEALGTIVGLVVRLLIIILCFWGAIRMGRKAKRGRTPN